MRRVIAVLGLIFGCIFGVYITFRHISNHSETQTHFRNIFYVILLCFWLSIISQSVHIFYAEIYGSILVTNVWGVITTVVFTGLIFSYLGSIYLTVKYSFGNPYKPSDRNMTILRIFIFIMVIIGVPGSIFSAMGQGSENIALNILEFYGLIATPVAMLIYIIISAVLLYIFVNRLNKIRNDSSNLSSERTLKNNMTLLRLVIRYCVLNGIKYTSTIILLIMFVLSLLYTHIEIMNVLWDIIFYIDSILNIICVYLQYNLGINHYNKFCVYCDKFLRNKKSYHQLDIQLQNLVANSQEINQT